MEINLNNYDIKREGTQVVLYPKTGEKLKAQSIIEELLNEGRIQEVLTHDLLPVCLSPSFSGKAVLDGKKLKLKQVVPLDGVTEMCASIKAIEHAENLVKRLIELGRDLPYERMLMAGNKSNRLNLSFKINGAWIRLRGFTIALCEANGIMTK